MRRDGRSLLVLLGLVLVASALAAWVAVETGQEAVALIMGVPILLVAVFTLWLALPVPAHIVVTDQPELELDDLLFFLYDDSPEQQATRHIPRDYLLQLHVAVVNLGDRKGIVAGVVLDQLLDPDGQPVVLPGAPERLSAMQWVQRSGYVNGRRHFENLNQLPPYVVDSNDALTLRFRCRRGITWREPSLTALQEVHTALARPIVKAQGHVRWRAGSKDHRTDFTVPVRVVQQQEYVKAIYDLTQGFTTLPEDVQEQKISIELEGCQGSPPTRNLTERISADVTEWLTVKLRDSLRSWTTGSRNPIAVLTEHQPNSVRLVIPALGAFATSAASQRKYSAHATRQAAVDKRRCSPPAVYPCLPRLR